MEGNLRKLRTAALLFFIGVVIFLLIYSRIQAYSLAPTVQPLDLRGFIWWQIPLIYIWDYVSHAWICLLFAFTTAGLFSEFLPKHVVTRYLSSGRPIAYLVAASIAPLFTACSCVMIPLFAGVMYAGGGVGPAITFLLMAPSANILSIMVTGEMLSWELALVRVIASFISAITIGVLVAKTPWAKKFEEEFKKEGANAPTVEVEYPPLDERLLSALKFGGFLAKRIVPVFIIGLVAVSYFEAYFPEEIVVTYFTGVLGVIVASVIGGPLYTPTLIEIVLGRSLVKLGMSSGATLAWLMGQPYDIPNTLAASRIVPWKVVISYAVLALASSITAGLIYGSLTGGL